MLEFDFYYEYHSTYLERYKTVSKMLLFEQQSHERKKGSKVMVLKKIAFGIEIDERLLVPFIRHAAEYDLHLR
jgi:hypothetical protein